MSSTSEQKVDEQMTDDSRYSLLTDALDQASHKIINKILRQKAFEECLPWIKKKHPEMMSILHQTFTHKVQKRMKEDVNKLFSDFALKEKLDFLDKLDTEQIELSKGEVAWRPTGDPTRDLLAYDVPALQAHKEKLLSDLKKLKAENEVEKKKIIEVMDKMSETEEVIERMLTKNEKALEVLSNIQTL